ncbi:MAG: glycosyltransferase, partial [Promethearchaeota archaeon]
RDKSYIKSFNNIQNLQPINLKDLKDIPLVNIIVPAWKEGEIFNGCLLNLNKLSYPRLNIIVNAGGSEKTLEIANSFKNYENFTVIYQEKGAGKVRAINECLSLVTEGVICLIDADIYLSDEHLLKMLFVIVNKNESVVVSSLKPSPSLIHKFLIRYLLINRNARFRKHFSTYNRYGGISPCTILNYEVIKKVGRFTEKRLIGDGESMGADILEDNYKIYLLKSIGVESFDYDYNIKGYISQNIRWIQNRFFNKLKRDRRILINNFLIAVESILLFSFPFFSIISINLFFFSCLILISMYIKKIRKIVFFKSTMDMNYYGKNSIFFYFVVLFYIYLDALINIYTFLEILFIGKKKFKIRKNIE